MIAWASRLAHSSAFVIAAIAGAAFPTTSHCAKAVEMVEARLQENQTIRQLAEQHLGDPDLWPEILKASKLSSIADISADTVLQVPVETIASADRAIDRSGGQIRKANLAGAQIFAPDEIGLAISLHDKALDRRLVHDWPASRDSALSSFSEATKALTISEARRDEEAEAVVTDRQGHVEGQKPAAIAWSDLALRATLIEDEKIRTLSDSTAQLTFRDASRLRFNANSNAVIQQLRYDPLTKQENAKVSLVEGDFYALLASKSERKSFSVDIPGAKAQIESGDFWVQSGDDGAKFTNYDSKPVDIATVSDKIVLGRNEGVVLAAGGQTKVKQGVLEPVILSAPADDRPIYKTAVDFSWAGADGAQGYWLEIGADQGFEQMIVSKFGIAAPSHRQDGLAPGRYYWRVAALDGFGLPGQRSEVRRFSITIDGAAPFLRINAPPDDAIVREASLAIEGASEPDAEVLVNRGRVEVTQQGAFTATVELAEGDNLIEVVATDPAGNRTMLSRRLRFMPDRADAIVFDPGIARDAHGRLLTGNNAISLAGRTKPSARVDITDSKGSLRGSAMSNEDGTFGLNVDLSRDSEKFAIAVTSPSGFREESQFEVVIDRTKPRIEFAEEPPRITSASAIFLRGRIGKPQARLSINGRPVELADGAFDEIINLASGETAIELVATDIVGNSEVAKFSVTVDSEPPKLIAAKSSPVSEDAGSLVAVEIEASDEWGLAASARLTLGLGTGDVDGILQFNAASKRYQGAIPLPRGKASSAVLKTVELADSAGNQKVFRLN